MNNYDSNIKYATVDIRKEKKKKHVTYLLSVYFRQCEVALA